MLKRYDIQGRVAVFIDAANILYSQKTLGWRVDYKKLKEYLDHETQLVSIHFYTGKVGADEKQARFLDKLAQFGFAVAAKEVKRIRVARDTYEWKGNLDVELALDAYRLKEDFDVCLLFSGDSDFAYLLDLLKQAGKRVFVVSAKHHVSRELIERAKYVNLKKFEEYISYKRSPPALRPGERSDKRNDI